MCVCVMRAIRAWSILSLHLSSFVSSAQHNLCDWSIKKKIKFSFFLISFFIIFTLVSLLSGWKFGVKHQSPLLCVVNDSRRERKNFMLHWLSRCLTWIWKINKSFSFTRWTLGCSLWVITAAFQWYSSTWMMPQMFRNFSIISTIPWFFLCLCWSSWLLCKRVTMNS